MRLLTPLRRLCCRQSRARNWSRLCDVNRAMLWYKTVGRSSNLLFEQKDRAVSRNLSPPINPQVLEAPPISFSFNPCQKRCDSARSRNWVCSSIDVAAGLDCGPSHYPSHYPRADIKTAVSPSFKLHEIEFPSLSPVPPQLLNICCLQNNSSIASLLKILFIIQFVGLLFDRYVFGNRCIV
jgi:hypothetical protein